MSTRQFLQAFFAKSPECLAIVAGLREDQVVVLADTIVLCDRYNLEFPA